MPTEPVLMPLWPRRGVTETLEWLTDVQTYEDGTEDRVELRAAPRQTFACSYYVPPALQPLINNIVYGSRTLKWWVPVWPQAQNVGAIEAALTTLICNTNYSEFYDGGSLLLWESPTKYQVIEIDTVASETTIDIVDATEAFTDAWLMPLRVGRLIGNTKRSFDGRKSVLEMSYLCDDYSALEPEAPAQYLGFDLYTDPGLLDGGSSAEEIEAEVYVHDESLGLVSYLAPWTFNRPSRIHKMMAQGPVEAWAMREFLHRRAGRSVPFWQPTFEADLRLNDSGALTTAISVYPDGYQTYAGDRTHIAIQQKDGTWLARAISSTILLGADELQIVLTPTLGGINASTIKRICFLGLRRLDADRAEIQHVGTGTAEVDSSAFDLEAYFPVLTEGVDLDYPAPGEFYPYTLTLGPYDGEAQLIAGDPDGTGFCRADDFFYFNGVKFGTVKATSWPAGTILYTIPQGETVDVTIENTDDPESGVTGSFFVKRCSSANVFACSVPTVEIQP